MSKLQDIRELAQEHATLVSSSPRDWMGYMDTAARLYRYPFTDQLLIHAQHPQATAPPHQSPPPVRPWNCGMRKCSAG